MSDQPPFITLLILNGDVDRLLGTWGDILTAGDLSDIPAPTILGLPDPAKFNNGQSWPDSMLRVGHIDHPPELGERLLAHLKEVLPASGFEGAFVEPGFYFDPA